MGQKSSTSTKWLDFHCLKEQRFPPTNVCVWESTFLTRIHSHTPMTSDRRSCVKGAGGSVSSSLCSRPITSNGGDQCLKNVSLWGLGRTWLWRQMSELPFLHCCQGQPDLWWAVKNGWWEDHPDSYHSGLSTTQRCASLCRSKWIVNFSPHDSIRKPLLQELLGDPIR